MRRGRGVDDDGVHAVVRCARGGLRVHTRFDADRRCRRPAGRLWLLAHTHGGGGSCCWRLRLCRWSGCARRQRSRLAASAGLERRYAVAAWAAARCGRAAHATAAQRWCARRAALRAATVADVGQHVLPLPCRRPRALRLQGRCVCQDGKQGVRQVGVVAQLRLPHAQVTQHALPLVRQVVHIQRAVLRQPDVSLMSHRPRHHA